MAALTIATRARPSSSGAKSRPAIKGVPSVSKYLGATVFNATRRRSSGFSDDRDGHVIDDEPFAQHSRIEIETTLPVRPSDYRYRRARRSDLTLLGTNQTANRWLETECFEEIATHVHAVHDFRPERRSGHLKTAARNANQI